MQQRALELAKVGVVVGNDAAYIRAIGELLFTRAVTRKVIFTNNFRVYLHTRPINL